MIIRSIHIQGSNICPLLFFNEFRIGRYCKFNDIVATYPNPTHIRMIMGIKPL